MRNSRKLVVKRVLLAALGLALAAGFYVALRPQPVPVDTAVVARGPLKVTVDEEAKTRIKDVYVVSAPITGKVLRSPLHVGDPVAKDQTVVAVIQRVTPSFIDVRSRLELEATVKAAEAGIGLAEAELAQAKSELAFATSELARIEVLTKKDVVPERTLEKARIDTDVRRADVARAEANVALRRREADSARAKLLEPDEARAREATETTCCFDVKSPESGRVLKLLAESETSVLIGTPLIEIGNPSNLEIVAELLSADAVRIKPGARTTVEGWGGPAVAAHVAYIEPSGFTKVSALGIEEQRVKTILDFDATPWDIARLGHDFRVFVRIEAYEAESALRVPLSALFRRGNDWSVFVVDGGAARERRVEVGQRNSQFGELVSGLKEGERIILHPSDRVADGVAIIERTQE